MKKHKSFNLKLKLKTVPTSTVKITEEATSDIDSDEHINKLDLSSDADSDSDKENQILSKDSNIVWKAGSRAVDPSTAIHSYGPRLSCQELTYLG